MISHRIATSTARRSRPLRSALVAGHLSVSGNMQPRIVQRGEASRSALSTALGSGIDNEALHMNETTSETHETHDSDPSTLRIDELLHLSLQIPEYQRPYTWERNNMQQLIEDVQLFMHQGYEEYRIGTIILYSPATPQRSVQRILLTTPPIMP